MNFLFPIVHEGRLLSTRQVNNTLAAAIKPTQSIKYTETCYSSHRASWYSACRLHTRSQQLRLPRTSARVSRAALRLPERRIWLWWVVIVIVVGFCLSLGLMLETVCCWDWTWSSPLRVLDFVSILH